MTTPEDVLEDPAVAGPAARAGFLLVAPEGLQKSWAHAGSPSQARDDVAFLRAVRADVLARFPIDHAAVVAAGFSQGSSMVWDLACYAAPDFTAFLGFSGAFWEPLPAACRSGPVRLRHVHGRDDTVMPLAGRAVFGPYRQGDVRQGFALWLAEDRCSAAADRFIREGELDCEEWTGCAAGRLEFCLRPGGHDMQAASMQAGLRWALQP
jgi:polyhydroxybutyrate depolymerase